MYARYILMSIPALALVLLAFVLAPILAGLSVLLRRDTLPGFLQWFSTVDDTLDGGQRQHGWPAAAGWRLWWQRTCWIARNPAQGFQAIPFGYQRATVFLQIDKQTVTADGFMTARYREYRYYAARISNDRTLFSYQRNVKLWRDIYLKLWFGWAVKESIGRLSLKCVPISFGRIKQ